MVRFIVRLIGKMIKDRLSAQAEQLILRFIHYVGFLIILVSVLNELGFSLSVLLGAAGVFGLAIGFASQTSVSNIISGFFLISEKPFVVGDTIQVGSSIGTVNSIDLLSIKLKTPDNRYIRIPNETMIRTEVVNITYFPIRRVNIPVVVAYKEDLRRVYGILAEIAGNEPLALKDPAPVILIDQLGNTGIDYTFGVWCLREDFFVMKTALMIAIKERFDAEKIEIPVPHMALYPGETIKPVSTQVNNKPGNS
ncbi:MAG: mechanosensitive ion channel family protein [Candidatus Cloacimonetes bacterium]|nr:mechanosensitive ion channel family protein [Candidatus Cloacimonadota bacterium]